MMVMADSARSPPPSPPNSTGTLNTHVPHAGVPDGVADVDVAADVADVDVADVADVAADVDVADVAADVADVVVADSMTLRTADSPSAFETP